MGRPAGGPEFGRNLYDNDGIVNTHNPVAKAAVSGRETRGYARFQPLAHVAIGGHDLLARAPGGRRVGRRPILHLHRKRARQLQRRVMRLRRQRDDQIERGVVEFADRVGRMPGQVGGRSPYLQAVHMDGPERLIGQIIPVEIVAAGNNSLAGKIVTDVGTNSASVLESQAMAAHF